MSDDELAQVADGRVFTGRQGVPLKLVDAIGGEREAIAWLESEKGVAEGLAGARLEAGSRLRRLEVSRASPRRSPQVGPDCAALRRRRLRRRERQLTGCFRFGKCHLGN